jgi:hypothetical protein
MARPLSRRWRRAGLGAPWLAALLIAIGFSLALAYFFGPHRRIGNAYVPNFVASIIDLSLGGAAVAAFVAWNRRRILAPRRRSALEQLARPLSELLGLVQAMYVEAIPSRPSHLPTQTAELLNAWEENLHMLDLTASPSVSTADARWMDLLHSELERITRQIQVIADRRAAVLTEEIEAAVAQLEVDPLLEVLILLPELARSFQPAPARTLAPYLSFLTQAGRHLEELRRRLTELFAAYEDAAGEAIEIDEVRWVEAVAPFWGYSNVATIDAG